MSASFQERLTVLNTVRWFLSRIMRASINTAGKVLYEGVEIQDVLILSEGTAESEGLLLIDKNFIAYLTSNAQDVKVLIEKIVALIDELSSALSTIDIKPVGGTGSAPAPGAASNIAQIAVLKAELDLLKGALK